MSRSFKGGVESSSSESSLKSLRNDYVAGSGYFYSRKYRGLGLEKNKVEEIESKVNIMFRRDKYMSCVSVCLLCVKMSPQIGSDNP